MSKHYVSFPDGSTRIAPRDGEHFYVEDYSYTWDGLLEAWVDWRGDLWKPKEVKLDLDWGIKKKENPDGCECGVWKTNTPRHSTWCKLYRKE